MARHETAHLKALKAIEKEGRKQCLLIYSATALALCRHWKKGTLAITRLFDVTGKVWNECASTNLHSMIEMCEKETGIEVQNGENKTWRDLPYLNGSLDDKPMTNAQWVYMRQQQKKWIAPQVMACMLIALHRKYGFGYDRCTRIYSQTLDIQAEFGRDPMRIRDAAMAETGIDINNVITRRGE